MKKICNGEMLFGQTLFEESLLNVAELCLKQSLIALDILLMSAQTVNSFIHKSAPIMPRFMMNPSVIPDALR